MSILMDIGLLKTRVVGGVRKTFISRHNAAGITVMFVDKDGVILDTNSYTWRTEDINQLIELLEEIRDVLEPMR